MKKCGSLIVVLAFIFTIAALPAAAQYEEPTEEISQKFDQILNFDNTSQGLLRATGRIQWTLLPNSSYKVSSPYPMEAGETITINCTYSPRTADVDFGLITPRGTFVYVTGKNGNCNQAIEVSQTDSYYFAVRNNSSSAVAVEIMGYVYY